MIKGSLYSNSFLLDFINCDYILNIQNQCFEFTLEENDAAKEFQTKLPLSITMTLISYGSGNNFLIYSLNNFWSKNYDQSSEQNIESGFIDAYNNNLLYINFYSGSSSETNFGKIKDPNKVIQSILAIENDKIAIEFMVGSCCEPEKITLKKCLCGSKTCSENQYCTNEGRCLEKCGPDAITDNDCLCGSNICSRDKYCKDGSCLEKCRSNAITDEDCLCGSNICSDDKYCTNDGRCLEKCGPDEITDNDCLCGSNICSRDK